jgi:hypothetical protein
MPRRADRQHQERVVGLGRPQQTGELSKSGDGQRIEGEASR